MAKLQAGQATSLPGLAVAKLLQPGLAVAKLEAGQAASLPGLAVAELLRPGLPVAKLEAGHHKMIRHSGKSLLEDWVKSSLNHWQIKTESRFFSWCAGKALKSADAIYLP